MILKNLRKRPVSPASSGPGPSMSKQRRSFEPGGGERQGRGERVPERSGVRDPPVDRHAAGRGLGLLEVEPHHELQPRERRSRAAVEPHQLLQPIVGLALPPARPLALLRRFLCFDV